MIVRHLQDAEKSARRIVSEGWESTRLLLKNDKHILRGRTEMQMACVFNPPLHGKEVHNAEGAYELEAEEVNDES